MKSGHGGKREGAGKKKGTLWPSTIDKIAAREAVRQLVTEHMHEMTLAQIGQAKGAKYLVTRDKASGKFIRVGPAMAANSQEETIEVWEKDPSTPAYADLMNRANDKPKEQEMEIRVSGTLEVVSARLIEARKRLAGR